MIDEFLRAASMYVSHRVWLISDLQQHDPARSRQCMYIAYEDFKKLNLPCEKIWYLGDSVEGANLEHLWEMTKMQEKVFSEIGVPVCYCPGNHDMDYVSRFGEAVMPFREMVLSHSAEGWKTTKCVSDFFFWDKLGDTDVLFIADHAAADGSWYFCHGRPFGTGYPYNSTDYRALARERDKRKKVITVSHYAYPGGNRATEYMGEYFPIGENVLLHVYGHAHIGDSRWAGKDWGRQISAADGHFLTQIDIASLEHGRGNAVRSAFMEIYSDGRTGIFFRNHQGGFWEKMLVL